MKSLFVLITLLLSINVFAQESLDKIVAVVNDEIILQSELQFKTAMFAAQRKLNPNDETLQRRVLNSMIEEKLMFAQALLDSITVPDAQVDQQLEQQIGYFVQQYGSREKVEEAYGMTIEKIKRELRDDVHKNLMAETVQQQKFGQIEATRREVSEFYNEYKDSLGLIPEKFTLSHIFINPTTTSKVTEKARNFAQTLLDSIKGGADFQELAKEHSEDPGSKKFGGDLGFVKRGVFYPEFESVAFSLAEGELSGVVKSPVGFHIIQLLERRGESIHTRHILVKVKPDDDADIKAIEFLSDIRDSIVRGFDTFENLAKKYSNDTQTKLYGGTLGVFEIGQLDKSLKDAVYKLKVGEISYPKRLDINQSEYGYHIVRLDKRVPEHRATLENDYQEIKQLADYTKKQNLYQEWVNELKKNIYWTINL